MTSSSVRPWSSLDLLWFRGFSLDTVRNQPSKFGASLMLIVVLFGYKTKHFHLKFHFQSIFRISQLAKISVATSWIHNDSNDKLMWNLNFIIIFEKISVTHFHYAVRRRLVATTLRSSYIFLGLNHTGPQFNYK